MTCSSWLNKAVQGKGPTCSQSGTRQVMRPCGQKAKKEASGKREHECVLSAQKCYPKHFAASHAT